MGTIQRGGIGLIGEIPERRSSICIDSEDSNLESHLYDAMAQREDEICGCEMRECETGPNKLDLCRERDDLPDLLDTHKNLKNGKGH